MRAVVLSSREVPSSESLLAGFELLPEAAPSRSAGWWDVRLWVISLGLGNGLHISNQWLGSSDCRRLPCGSPSLALVLLPEAVVLFEVTVTFLQLLLLEQEPSFSVWGLSWTSWPRWLLGRMR